MCSVIKNTAIFFGEGLGFSMTVAHHVNRFAAGQQFTGFVVQNFVAETNRAPLEFGYARSDAQRIVIARRVAIAASRFGDDDETIVLNFHLLVVDTLVAHIFDAANLEVNVVIAVVDETHLVGLGVPHAHDGVKEFGHRNRSVPEWLSLPQDGRLTYRPISGNAFQGKRRGPHGNRPSIGSEHFQRWPVPVRGLSHARSYRKAVSWFSAGLSGWTPRALPTACALQTSILRLTQF